MDSGSRNYAMGVSANRTVRSLAAYVGVGMLVAAHGTAVRAEQVKFYVDPGVSTVEMSAAGYLFGSLASTFDSQVMPLGGSLTLDVVVAGAAVQSVDFVALEFEYLVELGDPTVFTFTILPGFPGAGATTEAILPWGTLPPAGNPVTVFDPVLSLVEGDAGVASGTGGDLILTGPVFSFVGTAQYRNNPSVADGWPLNFGPYPLGDTFPGAPAGPNELDGVVTLVGAELEFTGTFLSFGRGGAGALQTAMIHTGVVTARTSPPCTQVVAADFDQDCDVDGGDVSLFLPCLSGVDVLLAAGCESKDVDLDADADLVDFALVQRCVAGEGVEPDPGCAG